MVAGLERILADLQNEATEEAANEPAGVTAVTPDQPAEEAAPVPLHHLPEPEPLPEREFMAPMTDERQEQENEWWTAARRVAAHNRAVDTWHAAQEAKDAETPPPSSR